MGLAASQARLLTITGRKSDCEFQSMRLSHQKIALARELADLSNEYQNSLTKTKLIYDYYGTGDTATQLSYGILMSPSVLNDYMPTLLTDSAGRVVLNNKYADVARAVGIPQEGLGTLPSENMRMAFINALAGNEIISSSLAETINSIPYNQAAGFGGDVTVSIHTKQVNIDELCEEYLSNYQVDISDLIGDKSLEAGAGYHMNLYEGKTSSDVKKVDDFKNLSLADLVTGTYSLVGTNADNDRLRGNDGRYDFNWRIAVENSELWQVLYEAATDLFDLGDDYSQKALAYAQEKLNQFIDFDESLLKADDKSTNPDLKQTLSYFNDHSGRDVDHTLDWSFSNVYDSVGLTQEFNSGGEYNDGIGVNLTYLVKAYLTYFADYVNGVAQTDAYGNDKYGVYLSSKTGEKVHRAPIDKQNFVTDDKSFLYTVRTGKEISSDAYALASFYDTLFNQICANGWTENGNVNDNEYLQKMLQNGMMFISEVKDDGYYYQSNYATDSYIKEIADETFIAQAEAKYNTEKAKLNSKEETLDLKMKNLDTEISSLTTEYDTVKNVISKQIEKSFKRYSA